METEEKENNENISFSDRLKNELEYQGLTAAGLAKYLNTTWSTVSGWIQRGSIPSATTAFKIAEYLNVPVEYLVLGKTFCRETHFSKEERQFVEKYRKLSSRDKKTVWTMTSYFNNESQDYPFDHE